MGIQADTHRRYDATISLSDLIVGIKGAGEMASGVAWSLYKSNICKIFMMEIERPLAVRRKVSFCESIYSGRCSIEGVEAMFTRDEDDIHKAWEKRAIAVIQDPGWKFLSALAPDVVIDATLAKINLGTHMDEAPMVIGLGPGFEAGHDVHLVIETHRGHDLGRIIEHGSGHPNTGVPGNIGGYTRERVLRAPCDGIFKTDLEIGVCVKEHQTIARVAEQEVKSLISGVLRGLIQPNSRVKEGLKIGDIDPRGDVEYCSTISEKARALGGSVLQAILSKLNTADTDTYSLAGAIGLSGRGVISLIGAGGKTSLMFKLANEVALDGRSVLTTTTTKIFFPEKNQSPHTVVCASWEKLIVQLKSAAQRMPHFTAGANFDPDSGKLSGLAPDLIDRIWRSGLFDVILVEADGSKQLPLKASARHEPVLPMATSHLVHLSGLEAIGQSVESAVHRPEILMENLTLEPTTPLTESHLADCILFEVQKADQLCRPLLNTIILNKADTARKKHQGKRIAHRLKGEPCIQQLAVLSLNQAKPVKYFTQSKRKRISIR